MGVVPSRQLSGRSRCAKPGDSPRAARKRMVGIGSAPASSTAMATRRAPSSRHASSTMRSSTPCRSSEAVIERATSTIALLCATRRRSSSAARWCSWLRRSARAVRNRARAMATSSREVTGFVR